MDNAHGIEIESIIHRLAVETMCTSSLHKFSIFNFQFPKLPPQYFRINHSAVSNAKMMKNSNP